MGWLKVRVASPPPRSSHLPEDVGGLIPSWTRRLDNVLPRNTLAAKAFSPSPVDAARSAKAVTTRC